MCTSRGFLEKIILENYKKQRYQLKELEPVIRKVLSEGGTFSFNPHGISMLPIINEKSDSVLLTKVPDTLKKYQVILYKRSDGAFVLHRIVKIEGDSCTMRGDHQYVSEPGIRREQMIGMAYAIIRDGKTLNLNRGPYYIKEVLWVKSIWIRRGIFFLRRCGSKYKRKIVKGKS